MKAAVVVGVLAVGALYVVALADAARDIVAANLLRSRKVAA